MLQLASARLRAYGVAFVLGFAACTAQAAGNTFVVDDANDPASGDAADCAAGNVGICSLRDAIAAAGGGDTIRFAASIAQITLHGELVIGDTQTHTLVIDGEHRVAIDGNHATRLFRTVPGAIVQIANITLRNGSSDAGSAIQNGISALVTLRDSRLEDNQASNTGGGLYNLGNLIVERTTVSGNGAPSGGGLYNAGIAAITASTFSNNSAGAGTGIGGGIYQAAGTLDLTNATLAGNTAGIGSALYDQGGLVALNSTLWGSPTPGGAYASGFVANSILINTVIQNCFGTFPPGDGGGNRAADASCSFGDPSSVGPASIGFGALADNGGPTQTLLPGAGQIIDQIDCATAPSADQRGARRPGLAPSTNPNRSCDVGAVEWNGRFPLEIRVVGSGAVNLFYGSAYIDDCRDGSGICVASLPTFLAGAATPTPYPLIATADAGHEFIGWSGDCSGSDPATSVTMEDARTCVATFGPGFSLVVNSAADPAIADPERCRLGNADICTLRDAVAAAKLDGGGTITFAAPIQAVTLDDEILFDAPGATVAVDGGGAVSLIGTTTRVLRIASGASVEIRGVAIADGDAGSDDGGGIENEGSLVLKRSTLHGNSAARGGALHNAAGAQATLINSSFADNSALDAGTDVYVRGSSVKAYNVTFGGGVSGVSAIVADDGAISVSNSLLRDCAFVGTGTMYYNPVGDPDFNLRNYDIGTSCGIPASMPGNDAPLHLGALAVPPGGALPVMMPGPGSAAIDGGSSAICNVEAGHVDERGVARPQGSECDSGAVEVRLYGFSGTASGQIGDVVLQLAGADGGGAQSVTVAQADSSFAFANLLPENANWAVTVLSAPNGQECTVAPASGSGLAADVTDLVLTCITTMLLVDVTHTDTTCYGGGNGTATANAIGGALPYRYLWSPSGGTSAGASGLSAGDYTVTVTDSLDATVSVQVTIGSPPPIVFDLVDLDPGQYGADYTGSVSASGGNGVVGVALDSGALPPGLDFGTSPGSSQGSILGTPTAAGSYDFRLIASDASTCEYSQSITMVVAPAPLTVRVDDATRVYGTANPTFGASYAGFVNGDAVDDLVATPAFATAADANAPAGTYAITASGALSPNYAPVFVDGTLTITQATQGISNFIASPAAPTYAQGGTFSVSATPGASTSPLVFSSNSPAVCTVAATGGDTATVAMRRAGSCALTADQAGDVNYTAAAQLALDVTIDVGAQTIAFAPPGDQPLGLGSIMVAPTASSGLAVSLVSDTASICSISGNGPFAIALLGAGTCSLTASQEGDADHAAAAPVTVKFVVLAPVESAVALTSSLNPSRSGQNVIFTVTVTPAVAAGPARTLANASASGAAVPTGTLVLTDNGAMLASLTLDATGTASYTTRSLDVGTHAITADYGGDLLTEPSSTTLTQVVDAAAEPAVVPVPTLAPSLLALLGGLLGVMAWLRLAAGNGPRSGVRRR
ncbi:choice-of-anchor Q domain-containing protein [Dokdonella sp.]|uniref:MBG domain-containing protein n=1 Tax=Dokdonella sp. TaxID=2291710 RepID=UPI001B29CA8B|nr:choice-of-anchor Q domain-containing protein [Dokdonella sp.]MBO9663242.1 Ig-like domain repeat protein [Dokdonella sp.]